MPITLLTLKQETARGYKLRLLTQGTTTTGGSTTLFTDTVRQEPGGEYDRVDAYVKFTNGLGVASVNQYLVRPITGFSTGNQTITFAPALVASVPSGTTYDIYKNFHPETDLELAINSSLREQFGPRPVYSIATTIEVADVRLISVPSAAGNTMTRLVKVERPVGSTNTDWAWRELARESDYHVTDNNGSLSIEIQYPSVASTILRMTGQRATTELAADTDTTEEPAHIIVLGARKYLALQEGDKAGIERWGRELALALQDYYKSRPAESLSVPRISVG